MAVPTSMADLSTTANSNSPAGSESPISTDDFLRAIQSILRHTNAKGADIASATTTDIGAATGEFVDVTGTTTITGLGTVEAGIERTVRFTGALTLTHNATSLILPSSANITTANGDVAQFRSLGSGNWKCVSYIRQGGSPLDNSVSTASLKSDVISGATEDTNPDRDADFGIIYDTSASGNKKALLTNFGRLVQRVEATPLTAYQSTTNAIPNDDTIPQSTEGSQYLSVAITPKKTTNRLIIRAEFYASADAARTITVALFNGGTDAIKAAQVAVSAVNLIAAIPLKYEMEAGSTSAITFTLRAGPAAGTMYINGNSASRQLGGMLGATLSVEEYE